MNKNCMCDVNVLIQCKPKGNVIFVQGNWLQFLFFHFHCFYILGNSFFCKSCSVQLEDMVGNKNQKENNFKVLCGLFLLNILF